MMITENLAPYRTDKALSGAMLAHFEVFLHEAPPRWRLRDKKFSFMRRFLKRKVKKNQIRFGGFGVRFSTFRNLIDLATSAA